MEMTRGQQHLVEENMALVHKVIAQRIYGIRSIGIFTYDDLFQIGCIGLCKAAHTDKFDYAHKRENTHSEENARFTTYAYRLILNEILNALEYATTRRAELVMAPDEIMELGQCELPSPDEEISSAEYYTEMEAVLKDAATRATGVTAKGIQALIYTSQGYSSTEIASMMGAISCHNVTAWISKARKFLRADIALAKILHSA